MGETDQVLASYMQQIEERQTFVDGIFKAADGKDLTDEQLEMINDQKAQMEKVNAKVEPLLEMRRISGDSAARVAEIAKYMQGGPAKPREIEYRSAGEYVLDYWRAGLGHAESVQRIDIFNRAAAHQTTADNPGLLPTNIIGPVVNYVDSARPVVSLLGPRQLGAGTWNRPKVTQHTQIALQPVGEKNELVSRKMLISNLPVTAKTFGGYVNVSRQDIDWTQPSIMDVLIGDLAAQYAIETENAAVDDLTAGATTGPTLATGALSAAAAAAAFWTAAGSVFNATKGQGRIVAVCGTDMLGLYGPLFAPVNPQNAQSAGFEASSFSTGLAGSIAGIPVYVSPGMAALTTLVMSTAAAEVYEDRIGALQVVEPSVLGVQLAYAGYFADVVLEATGIQKIVKTP